VNLAGVRGNHPISKLQFLHLKTLDLPDPQSFAGLGDRNPATPMVSRIETQNTGVGEEALAILRRLRNWGSAAAINAVTGALCYRARWSTWASVTWTAQPLQANDGVVDYVSLIAQLSQYAFQIHASVPSQKSYKRLRSRVRRCRMESSAARNAVRR
jgi:hypothetical protein